ncbi:ABC transporter permease [Kordiimonas sp. SCSIO 12603]|uniref:ABC transporter permease n=1 Tax=Kordiimonas sp. SCSIO 12603 TaxID=2829596 RepID=UPI0021056835|nr:ABC transporter permease [Kordiimonas sp. SCSIO 12603]UTW57425.1 ABC transporter permease [Kordiimonas sp. SCSIO 12603]
MFKNYFLTAWRHLLKNRLFTAINIIGLSIGLMSCILILLFVQDELSYDRIWEDSERLYQVNTTYNYPGSPANTTSRVTGRMKEAMRLYFKDDIEAATRLNSMNSTVRIGGSAFKEAIQFVDAEFTELFQLDVINGDMSVALSNTSNIAINASFAQKYFGNTNPIGQTLEVAVYDLDRVYTVAAVFEDLPHNTTLSFQVLALIDESAFLSAPWEFDGWDSANGWLYFKLKSDSDEVKVSSQLKDFVNSNVVIPSYVSTDKDAQPTDFWNYSFQKLVDVQLNAISNDDQMKELGALTKVVSFSIVAMLILAVACVNFVNLATAKSTKRAREIAIRKVLGAKRGQLIRQHLGESSLLVGVALLIGLVLVELLLPFFSSFLNKHLILDLTNPIILLQLASFVIVIGLLAGAYPALALSNVVPATVLKANKSSGQGQSALLRQILVVFQFAISIGLIVATGVIYAQTQYSIAKDVGYNTKNLLSIRNFGTTQAAAHQKAIRDQILRLPGVTSVAVTSSRPAGGGRNSRALQLPGQSIGGLSLAIQAVDHEFLETFNIPLITGRSFDRARSTDGTPRADGAKPGEVLQGTVMINEKAVTRLGFGTPDQALGKAIRIVIAMVEGQEVYADLSVIGVVKDTVYHRPRNEGWGEAYYLEPNYPMGGLTIRYAGERAELVEGVRGIWQNLIPTVPFQYEFVEDVIQQAFSAEKQLAILFVVFSLLAIIVACMGLYGLAAFTAEQRTKEIGVRKVLGASVYDIVQLLVWQFSKPVLLACIVAWPVAIFAMLNWLETFPYRMDTWILFPICLGAGAIATLIAWGTVGGNAAKVARANPVKALRYE